MTIYAGQLRGARGLLGWNQLELSRRSKVGIATIRRLEAQDGVLRGMSDTIWKVQAALEKAGIVFIEGDDSSGPGVKWALPLDDSP